MLFPVLWTALRRCVWTVSAPARLTAALRLSTVNSPGSEGLTQLGELAWVSCAHGGRRYGQGGGHGDSPWLRPHQWKHSGHQSGDHRVLQVGPLRRWCRCVCFRVWGAPRARWVRFAVRRQNTVISNLMFDILVLKTKHRRRHVLSPRYKNNCVTQFEE